MSFELAVLTIFIICIVESRVFRRVHSSRDALSLLSFLPLALTLSYIFIFTLDLTSLLLFFPSLSLLLLNLKSVIHYASSLYIDGFSAARKCAAFIVSAYTFLLLFILILFSPKDLFHKRDFVKTEERFSGSFTGGFVKTLDFERDEAVLYTYRAKRGNTKEACEAERKEQPVIFLSDKRSRLTDWEALFEILVHKGARVYTGEFYTDDGKYYSGIMGKRAFVRFFMTLHYLFDGVIEKFSRGNGFHARREFYSFCALRELEALLTLVKARETDNVKAIIAGDESARKALKDFMLKHPQNVSSLVYLPDFKRYKHKGFALIEESEPLLSYILDKMESRTQEKSEENFHETLSAFADFILSNSPSE